MIPDFIAEDDAIRASIHRLGAAGGSPRRALDEGGGLVTQHFAGLVALEFDLPERWGDPGASEVQRNNIARATLG